MRSGDADSAGGRPADETPPLGWAFLCPNPTCDTELVVLPEQLGRIVECPVCGFRFGAPDEPAPQDIAEALAPALDARESAAADVLGSLAEREPRGTREVFIPEPPPRPAGNEASAAKTPSVAPSPVRGLGRRLVARTLQAHQHVVRTVEAAERPPSPATMEVRASVVGPLVLTWGVATVVAGGITAAALAARVPELVLVALALVGLAVFRTVLVVRGKGTE